MKKLFVFILVTFSLFSQKSARDSFTKWKAYEKTVDHKILKKTLKVKSNHKMMCPGLHSVTTYTDLDKILLIKGETCGECGCSGYDLYFKDDQLLLARSYFVKDTMITCRHDKSVSETYFLDGNKIVNFKALHSKKTEEELLKEIRNTEASLREALQSKCFE